MKTTPWNKIKAEYLQEVPPKELAAKYKVDIDRLYKKIENDKWAAELREIKGNIGNKVQDRIEKLTNLALDTLEEVANDVKCEKNTRVQAAKALLDISGLKNSKQVIEGIESGVNVIINRQAVQVESNN